MGLSSEQKILVGLAVLSAGIALNAHAERICAAIVRLFM